MSRWNTNAARALDEPPVEAPIFVGDGFEVFEGWGALLPEQIAECERAEAELVSGRVKPIAHDDVQRTLGELRLAQGG